MRTGAVIVAAGHKSPTLFRPMMPVGDTTVIRRIIIILQQAGVDPVVVITGKQGDELEKHISKLQVICLRNERYERTQMFDSICMGLQYLEGLCDRALVLPAKYPLLLTGTVNELLKSTAAAACPVCGGHRGHPVLIRGELIGKITGYDGPMGLRGALRQPEIDALMDEIPVEDEGIFWPAEGDGRLAEPPKGRERIPMHPKVQLALAREELFFDQSMARFLQITDHTGSMQTACRQMHMSYTKGWKMLKAAEKQLGYPLLITQSGGAEGGSSRLSAQARELLDRYFQMEKELNETAKRLFENCFLQGNEEQR